MSADPEVHPAGLSPAARRGQMSLAVAAAGGRDNNLNLIRMAAALAVLVSHAWPILYGAGALEPLERLTGATLGSHAVTVFFVLSGFLIAASAQRRLSWAAFWRARAARLFPGLILANLMIVLLLGPLVSALTPGSVYSLPGAAQFLLGNSVIVKPIFKLPGVFETNPYPMVHGSIWTLRHELACYGLVALLAGIGLLGRRRGLLAAVGLGYPLLWLLLDRQSEGIPASVAAFVRLSFSFLLGVLAWIWRDRIRLSVWGIGGLAGLAWAAASTPLGPVLQGLCIAYGAFYLSYVPGGGLRRYNRLGDYSYGTYVYAFPMQGLVVWAFGVTSPLLHCLLALIPTLTLAVLSWHWIERPALAWGRRGGPGRPASDPEPGSVSDPASAPGPDRP